MRLAEAAGYETVTKGAASAAQISAGLPWQRLVSERDKATFGILKGKRRFLVDFKMFEENLRKIYLKMLGIILN